MSDLTAIAIALIGTVPATVAAYLSYRAKVAAKRAGDAANDLSSQAFDKATRAAASVAKMTGEFEPIRPDEH